MEKLELLTKITKLASINQLSKDEIVKAFEKGKPKKTSFLIKEIGISEVLYLIGGFIVVTGIGVLISQNWSVLSPSNRILITLGFAIAAYSIGVMLNKEEKYGAVGYAFHLIAALILPFGIGVALYEAGLEPYSSGMQTFISWTVMIIYLLSYFKFKKPLFTIFTIVYATWFFFAVTNFLLGNNPVGSDLHLYEYRYLLVGISYVSLGYYWKNTDHKELTPPLYWFGSFFVLGAAFSLMGWGDSDKNVLWEIFYPFLAFGVLISSIRFRTQAFLTTGTIFLMSYILKITNEYFSGTFGWSLSLMFCGIALIGIGYYAFTLNKKALKINN